MERSKGREAGYAMNGDAGVTCLEIGWGNAPPCERVFGWRNGSGAILAMTRDPFVSALNVLLAMEI
jgi:hypothetical protein